MDQTTGERVRQIITYLVKERTENKQKATIPYYLISARTKIHYDTLYNLIRPDKKRPSGWRSDGDEEQLHKLVEAFHFFLPYDRPEWEWVVEYLPDAARSGGKLQQILLEKIEELEIEIRELERMADRDLNKAVKRAKKTLKDNEGENKSG